ncbi:CoA pyrophosphatase [Devosia sp.]|uniref:CoA pyrophosphatase n=1 Tax=Devosia sp. TaxID=1871048 RepID=UPI002EFB4826
MATDDALIERIAGRLLPEPQPAPTESELVPDWLPSEPVGGPPVPAAVLIALVQRPAGFSVLYTERSPALRAHSGQVSFPGGRIDPGDAGAADAALREAGEEVALDRHDARVLGYMPRYYTGTNYLITPVVAVIAPSRPFIPNPQEVRSVFEVPLERLMRDESYGTFSVMRGERQHSSWKIEHGELTIWGITANLTRRFHDMALIGESVW